MRQRQWKVVDGGVVHDVFDRGEWLRGYTLRCDSDTPRYKLSWVEEDTTCLGCIALRGSVEVKGFSTPGLFFSNPCGEVPLTNGDTIVYDTCRFLVEI